MDVKAFIYLRPAPATRHHSEGKTVHSPMAVVEVERPLVPLGLSPGSFLSYRRIHVGISTKSLRA